MTAEKNSLTLSAAEVEALTGAMQADVDFFDYAANLPPGALVSDLLRSKVYEAMVPAWERLAATLVANAFINALAGLIAVETA